MAVVGTAVIDVIANTARLEAGVKRAEKRLGVFTDKARVMSAVVTAVATGAGALFVKSRMDSIDALAKEADRLDTNIGALAAYKVQAELAGVGGDKFAMALQRQIVNLGKAREGTGEAADMVKRLGLNINELAAMSGDQQFEALAAAISKLPTQIDRANAAAAVWGARDGAVMLNLIQEMGPESAELRRQLDAVGVTISRIDAAKVEAANDAMDLAGQSALGLGNTIAVAVSPFIERLAKQWFDASVAAGGFRDTVTTGMMMVSASVGAVGDVLRVVHIGLKAIELAGYGAAAATNLVLNPFLNPEIVQASVDNLMRVRQEYDALVASPMPSEGIREGFFEIIEGANQAAAAVAKVKEASSGVTGAIASAEDPKAAKEAAKFEEYVNDLYARNAELITGKDAATLKYQATLTDLNELVARGTITQEEYNAAVERAGDAYDKARSQQQELSIFADQAARNIQGIGAALLRGEQLGDSFFNTILRGLANIASEIASQQIFTMLFNAIGGAFGNPLLGATLLGGGRAYGGPVMPGAVYPVNEKGDPEVLSSGGRDYLLTGSKAGQVSPAKPGRGGTRIVFAPVYHINASGGTSAAQIVALDRVLQANNRRLKADLAEAKLRKF